MKKFYILTLCILCIFAKTIYAQQIVLTKGNVNVVQNADGWQILLGNNILGHGEGVLDIENLPPAFIDMLNYYSTLTEKTIKKSIKKASSITYGPLLNTAWNQTAPYNNQCPTLDGYSTVAGCSTISSGQIMNYFRYCKPLNLSGTGSHNTVRSNGNYCTIASPYITSTSGKNYNYKYSYTPDFEKIATDDDEMAKFIVGIAFAQKAIFGQSGTSTYETNQLSALKDIFGYTCENYSITSLTTNNYIANAIKKGWPVIISGENASEGGHSFIVDGYNGNEFHIDYGWGGNSNGWFTSTQYPNKMSIIIAHPNVSNATYMQAVPKYLVINNKKISMVETGNDALEYIQSKELSLEKGYNSFYFEYSDGSKLAPYKESILSIQLGDGTNIYKHYGNFISTATTIFLSNDYKVNFYHNLAKGEIRIELADVNLTVEGKVLDENLNPLKNAIVTTAKTIPTETIDCQNINNSTSGFHIQTSDKISFIPQKNYLSQIELMLWLKGNPGNLTVSILDKDMKTLWTSTYPKSKFSVYGEWYTFNFDNLIPVTVGQKYYIQLTANHTNDNYYVWAIDKYEEHLYKVYGVADYYTYTDADGNYTFSVEKYWSGNLYAHYGTKDFNTVVINKITNNITNKNFVEGGIAYKIKFVNYNNQELQTINVKEGEKPIYSGKNPTKPETKQYTYTFDGWDSEIIAAYEDKIYTAIFFETIRKYNIKFVCDDKILQSTEIEYGKIPTYDGETPTKPADKQYTYTFSNWDSEFTAVDSDKTYTAKFSNTLNKYTIIFADNENILQTSEFEYGVIPIYNGQIPLKLADKQYTYTFAGWDFDITTVDGNKTYTAIFSETKNKYTINFVDENGEVLQSSEIEYGKLPEYIGEKPHKPSTETSRFIFTGWEPEITEVSENATYTATFLETEKKYKITYYIDNEEYETINNLDFGQEIKLIDKPEKEGYTFSGWICDYTIIPDDDVEAFGTFIINKYIVTFVDGNNISNIEVNYGESVEEPISYKNIVWYTSDSLAYNFNNKIVEDITLYAHTDKKTSIDILPKVSFNVYPNPAKDYIKITYDKIIANDYKIYNINGRLIKSGNITENPIFIDVSNLQSGSYIIKFSNSTATIKFIKE